MKTLCIGLDGVPRRSLEVLAEWGVMPALGDLIQRGSLSDLEASIPEISAVSWSDFMTGRDAGSHGIYGFTDLVPGQRKIRFPRFSDLKSPTFWDQLGDEGKKSVVLNQPATYPARPIPGALVSGFVALELDRAVYPARYLTALEKMKYRVDVETRRALSDPDGLLADLHSTLKSREEAVNYFWTHEKWDFFQVVVTGTDRLQHFLWDAFEQEDHPKHRAVLDYYRAVDAFVGRLTARFLKENPEGAFFVLSDHGFTQARKEVRINVWLKRQGYLSFKSEPTNSLADLAPCTKLFALDPGRLYFTVEPGEELMDRVREELLALTWQGEPVFRACHRRQDIYSGSQVDRAPHLVLQGRDGFDLKGSLQGEEIFVEPRLPGMHNPQAFLLANRPLPAGLKISQVAAHIKQECLA